MEQFKISVFNVLLFAVLFQSCKLTKDYKRPDLNLPSSFIGTTLTGKDKRPAQVPDFATFFLNKDLVCLLDTVVHNNLDLRVAAENVLASRSALKSIKLNYLPELSLQVNTGIQRTSKNSMTGTFVSHRVFEDYSFAGNLSWEIDFWGKLKKQRQEALTSYLSQVEVKRALRVQLIAQTSAAYYGLLGLDEQLKIARKVEKAMDTTLSVLKTQFEVGEVNSLAVKQAEAQVAQTRALIAEILASIRAQENALRTLTNNYPGTIARSGNLEEIAFNDSLQVGVPAEILAGRPDVQRSELELRAADARLGIANANFYPSLRITAQGGLNSIVRSNWFMVPASIFGSATAGLVQPIFNRREIKSAYEQALHNREAAVHSFRKTVLVAVEEVSTALTNIEFMNLQLQEVAKRKVAMNKAIEDAQFLYINGEANYLEVLTVQQNYFQTELDHTAQRLKAINLYISLYTALGGN